MENTDAKEALRQKVHEVLSEFRADHIDLDTTSAYLMDLIEAGDPMQYEHSIRLRAHD